MIHVILALAIVAATALTLGGIPIWLLALVAVVPWILVARQRLSLELAVPAIGLAAMFFSLVLLIVTGTLHLDLASWSIAASAAAGLVGIAFLAAGGRVRIRLTRANASRWLAPLVGSAVWFVVLLSARVTQSNSSFSWAMNGDVPNYLLFARENVYRGGIAIGADQNPVPLPSGLLAFGMAPGRANLPANQLAEHDVLSVALVWALLIGLVCYVAGVAIASTLSTARPLFRAVASAGGSLVPLTWSITGYPLEFGFFNAHIAIVIVLSSWVIFFASRGHPVFALAVMPIAATLLLAVWSPLVLFPAAFAIAMILQNRGAIMAHRGRTHALLVLGLLQLGAFGLGVTLPTLLNQGEFLSATGGVFTFPRVRLPAMLLIAIVIAALVRKRSDQPAMSAAIAIAASSTVGLGVLFYVARDTSDMWSGYYSLKFAWLSGVIATIVILSLLVLVIERRSPNALVRWIAVGAVLPIFIGLQPVPLGINAHPDGPLERILSGSFQAPSDETATYIFALSDPEQRGLLWQSDVPSESSVDYWLLQLAADSMTENQELRVLAYRVNSMETADLCEIARALPGIEVYTVSERLQDELDIECPSNSAVVIVGPYLESP